MLTTATPAQRCAAKEQLLADLQSGYSVPETQARAVIPCHPATIYRLRQRLLADPLTALEDGRHGHPVKLRGEVHTWLVKFCQAAPHTPSHVVQEDASPARWDADLDRVQGHWWEPRWVATPMPTAPTEPKLVPIVTTAADLGAAELAQTYTHRWPAQENSIRDYLLALGLDTNHGYATRRVENSEVTKRRAELDQRLANLQRWAEGARVRGRCATRLYMRRCRETKEQATALYRTLNDHQWALVEQGVDDHTLRATIKEEPRVADAEIAAYEQRQWRATIKVTPSLPNASATAASSANSCDSWRIWLRANGRCMSWTTQKTK